MVKCSGSYINYIAEAYYGTLEYPERTPEVVERGVSTGILGAQTPKP